VCVGEESTLKGTPITSDNFQIKYIFFDLGPRIFEQRLYIEEKYTTSLIRKIKCKRIITLPFSKTALKKIIMVYLLLYSIVTHFLIC
jgi:hypothetical protein